jgi:hypothetical protein
METYGGVAAGSRALLHRAAAETVSRLGVAWTRNHYRIACAALPLFLVKTGVCLRRLAKASDEGKIALFLGKNRVFGVVFWFSYTE